LGLGDEAKETLESNSTAVYGRFLSIIGTSITPPAALRFRRR
jgi:hypothetical protein